MEILKLSQQVKKDADSLILKSKLIEILKKHGKVEFTGSYAADLMIEGDIDIHIFVDKLDKKNKLKKP